MAIQTKKQSDELIRFFGLNRIEGQTFSILDINKAIEYIRDVKFSLLGIRDRKTAMGKFYHGVTKQEALEIIKLYEEFTICESLFEADAHHLLLQGEIEINSNLDIMASLNDEPGMSNRIAMKNPKYKLNFNDATDKAPKIIGLDRIINYLYAKDLFNCTVEFSYYDIPVGVRQENIIIWELRNY